MTRQLYNAAALVAAALLLAPSAAFALNCYDYDTPPGFVRDGSNGTCVLMKVNADGSINATVSGSVTSTPSPAVVTPTDKGTTITTGGTPQTPIAANASRKGGWVQNPCSATEDLFVSVTTTATTTGIGDQADLAPCASFSLLQAGTVITAAVSVNAATTGHRFLAVETQ